MQLDRQLDGRHQLPVVWRARAIGARALLCLAILGATLAGPAPARGALKAPGLEYGPTVLHEGLLWSSTSGVSLSSATGTRLLVPHLQLQDVVVGGGWLVAADEFELRAGKIGGRLAPIPALELCQTNQGTNGSWLDALSGGYLYVVLQARCLGDAPEGAQVLARIQLSSRRVQRIAPVRAGAVSLVVAGRRLALTYLTHEASGTGPVRARVDVRDSRRARLLYSLVTPQPAAATTSSATVPIVRSSEHQRLALAPSQMRRLYSRTQLDAEGDVLVTGAFGETQITAFGWWGNARTRVAHALVAPADGTLSEGHIAYVSSRGGVEHIDVFNLTTAATRTEVELRGAVRAVGVGLRKNRLAWAQQSYGYTLRGARPCVEFGPLGDPELAQSPLSVSGPPMIIDAPAAVPLSGPPCPRVFYS